MAKLVDPDRLRAYTDALRNWCVGDYIQFELNELAYRFIRAELNGITTKELGRLMHNYVDQGGEIDEVLETRRQWSDQYEFHHDLRIPIGNTPVYVETRLHYRVPVKPDDSWILVVNVHAW